MLQTATHIREMLMYLFYIEGSGQYAYVAVAGNELGSFRRACNTPGTDIAQHATVLASGKGAPDAETKARMAREYGFKTNRNA